MRMVTRLAYLLIGIALVGIFATVIWAISRPRIDTVPAPASAVLGAPDRPIRIVSYNILHNQRGRDAVIAEIRRLNPDVVFLQEAESRDVGLMSQQLDRLHMVYFPSQNLAGDASWGNAILSKLPLYGAASIPNPGGGSFGVWAYAVVDNKKFMLACVHLSATWKASPLHLIESTNNRNRELSHLRDAWTLAGSPPIVIGGDFNQMPVGNNYELMTRDWTDALKQLKHDEPTFHDGLLQTRIDYFLASKEFTANDGAVVQSNASDHSPIWIELLSASKPATTRSSK